VNKYRGTFSRVWHHFALGGDPWRTWDYLVKNYNGTPSHRQYHNGLHIAEGFAELEEWGGGIDVWKRKPEVTLGFAYHDVVYDPMAHDNEAQSKDFMENDLLNAGATKQLVDAIGKLIMITSHKVAPTTDDEALVVDIDLSILGKPAERFDEYEKAIRAEYAHIPDDAFRKGRSDILQKFLARDRIYTTEYFYNKYEKSARANLERSLSLLAD
jgi:predicted metal-dependent HD superfamily phosphohydrolase